MTTSGEKLERLLSQYDDLLELCDALEGVADGLPKLPPPGRCRLLAYQLEEMLAMTHHEEGQVLLPMLEGPDRPELRHLASRLRREHDADSMAAIEIRDTLLDMARDRLPISPDAIGYMLRSFFESLRRHVRTEQDMIAVLAEPHPRPGALH